MRDLIDLRNFWRAREGEKLVLCTLVRKKYFGYRSVGAKKIVGSGNLSCGLMSGGCLESEIDAVARDGIGRLPFIKSFSTMENTDRLFGYQAGCAGVIEILFERLPDACEKMDLYLPFGAVQKAEGVHVSLQEHNLGKRYFSDLSDHKNDFFDFWMRPITLCVIGCGPDAPAFADFANPMGWSLRFIDYRGHYTLPLSLKREPEIFPVDEIAHAIPDDDRAAIILMTHNYEADLTILSGLSGRRFGYVGCLGPRQRYDQMKLDMPRLHDLAINPDWERIVHAPAGIFINGRAPMEIALSIVAQIQNVLRPDER